MLKSKKWHISGHPWNKGISFPQLHFWVRLCEVTAIVLTSHMNPHRKPFNNANRSYMQCIHTRNRLHHSPFVSVILISHLHRKYCILHQKPLTWLHIGKKKTHRTIGPKRTLVAYIRPSYWGINRACCILMTKPSRMLSCSFFGEKKGLSMRPNISKQNWSLWDWNGGIVLWQSILGPAYTHPILMCL